MGKIKDFQTTLELKQGVVPKFFRPRSVPFALKNAIDTELNRLVDAGILKKVKSSLWVTSMVPVLRKDGRIRLCGDYKVTVNQSLEIDQHPRVVCYLVSSETVFKDQHDTGISANWIMNHRN